MESMCRRLFVILYTVENLASALPCSRIGRDQGRLGARCFGPKQFQHIVPKHLFLQSLKFGMFVLTWAESTVPGTCAGELHAPFGDVFDLHIIYIILVLFLHRYSRNCVLFELISMRIILLVAKNVI